MLIAATPNPRVRLLILEQWRAGLRVSEALALQTRDLYLDTDRPTLLLRQGKGRRPRVVPVHPELQAALITATGFGALVDGPLIPVTRAPPGGGSGRPSEGRWKPDNWVPTDRSAPTRCGTALPATFC